MGFQRRKGESVVGLVAVLMIVLGLEVKCCRAAVGVKSNTSYECKGNGRLLDDCRIAEDLEVELDNLDFLMNPNVIRILADGKKPSSVSDGSNDPNHQAVRPCPKGQQYTGKGGCIAINNGGKIPENPGLYNKGR